MFRGIITKVYASDGAYDIKFDVDDSTLTMTPNGLAAVYADEEACSQREVITNYVGRVLCGSLRSFRIRGGRGGS